MRQATAMETVLEMFGPRGQRAAHALSQTPGQLRLAMAVMWLLTAIFAWMTSIGLERHRHVMQTIGRDSGPSIIAAQSIKANIASLHGEVMRQFLGTQKQAEQAAANYRTLREQITDGLITATRNITYGDDERVPIRNLLNGLAQYDEAIARADALRRYGEDAYLPSLRQATLILDNTLNPAVEALDKANQSAMNEGYINEQADAGWATTYVILSALLLLAAMAGVQILIQRRMHRRLSLPLLAAALLTIGWTCCAVNAMRDETEALRVAKDDAFGSIGAMWRARADAFNAESHLGMSLLDAKSARSAREVFSNDSSDLARFSQGETFASVESTFSQSSGGPPGFQGYIAAELNNITFEGEKDAAMEMLRQYGRYMSITQEVLADDHGGQHPEAVMLLLGESDDQATGALTVFDSALGRVLDINQAEFDRAVGNGFADVEGLWIWNLAAMLIIMMLGFWCISQRLREYNE